MLRKKEKETNTTTLRKKNPSHKLKQAGFVIRKKKNYNARIYNVSG